MRRVTISAHDGLALSAAVWDGPAGRTPILCLPGICRSTLDFEGLAARHRARRRVVALDYAGHGESERAADPERYRPFTLARDVMDCLAALHLPRAVVVGVSFGGLVSMAMSLVRPASVAGVVLGDIGPEIGAVAQASILERLSRDVAFPGLDEAIAYWREVYPANAWLNEADWHRFTERTFAPRGAGGQWRPRWDPRLVRRAVGPQPGPPVDLWKFFGGLAGRPLMLVHGEDSQLLEKPTVARMQRARPDMVLATLPQAGHAPTLDEAPLVRPLDAFLDAIP